MNNIKKICDVYGTNYEVTLNGEKYSVEVTNNDFNDFEVKVFSNDIELNESDDDYQDVKDYLNEEKLI